MVDLLVPPPEDTGPGKLTVGKVYGGMLILENWKLSRFGQGFNTNKGLPVSLVTPVLSFSTPLLNLFSCMEVHEVANWKGGMVFSSPSLHPRLKLLHFRTALVTTTTTERCWTRLWWELAPPSSPLQWSPPPWPTRQSLRTTSLQLLPPLQLHRQQQRQVQLLPQLQRPRWQARWQAQVQRLERLQVLWQAAQSLQ